VLPWRWFAYVHRVGQGEANSRSRLINSMSLSSSKGSAPGQGC
jgi:hypothetical protein